MVYRISSPIAGTQPIADTSTVKNHPLGTIVKAYDPAIGEGEFIYLQGIGSTIVGSGVSYDAATFLTALASIVGGIPRSIAIAMSANVASQYGWYQISGRATVAKATATTLVVASAVGITSGLAVAAVTGKRLSGAIVGATTTSTVPAAVTIAIDRPRTSSVAEA